MNKVMIPQSSQVQKWQHIASNWSDMHAQVSLDVADVKFCNCFKDSEQFQKARRATSNAAMHELANIQCDLRAKAIREQTANSVEVSPDTTMAMARAALARKAKGKGPPTAKPLPIAAAC